MPQSFTPIFRDMVRVSTSTLGTGPLACGPAVAGFTSFAEAVSVGDSFYYSVQNADKPQEREVGRGTFQSDGTISRQPLQGPLVNFSNGAKTISLVTSADWYAQVQGNLGQPGGTSTVDTRAGLKALDPAKIRLIYLLEAGRQGLFAWNPAVPVAKHQADPAEAIHVAPLSNADGAWVRQFDGGIRVDWFGAVGDGVTDDTAAFVAMRTYLGSIASNPASGLRRAPPILLGPKTYFLASSFDCKGFTARWIGAGGGYDYWSNTGATTIKMASGCTWYFQAANTEGPGAGTTIPFSCAGSVFECITWQGPGQGVGTANLANMRATVHLNNCRFIESGGHGLAITGTIGGGGTAEGNVNVWTMNGGACSLNGQSGLYVNGADANAGTCWGVSFNFNNRHGTEDESFLGNDYYGCHWNGNIQGHLKNTNPNSTCKFFGYWESGYPLSVIAPRSIASGTNATNQVDGASIGANDIEGAGRGTLTANGFCAYKVRGGKTAQIKINVRPDTYPGIEIGHTDWNSATGTVMRIGPRVGTGIMVEELATGSNLWLRGINGNAGVRYNFGRSAPPPGYQGLSNFVLGYENFVPDGKVFAYAPAKPATGDIGKGEIRWNDGSATTKEWGWWCNTGHASNGGSWDTMFRRLYGASTFDPPSIAAGAAITTTVNVPGCAVGDIVTAADFGASIQPLRKDAWVSASNVVSVEMHNPTAAAVDLGSLTLKVEVTRQ